MIPSFITSMILRRSEPSLYEYRKLTVSLTKAHGHPANRKAQNLGSIEIVGGELV